VTNVTRVGRWLPLAEAPRTRQEAGGLRPSHNPTGMTCQVVGADRCLTLPTMGIEGRK
jgi:hypothetical protein